MLTKLILLLTLISYSFIVAQSYMYIIALKEVQEKMNAVSYIELRKLLDTSFRAKFKYAVSATLLTNLLLVIVTAKYFYSIYFITAAIAFIALVIDLWFTIKGNMPINNLINTWTANNYPDNWADQRRKWLQVFQYRQIANITGFICLLAGAVFGSK